MSRKKNVAATRWCCVSMSVIRQRMPSNDLMLPFLKKSAYITEPMHHQETCNYVYCGHEHLHTAVRRRQQKKKKKKRKTKREREKKTETTTSVLQKLHDILMVIANWHRCIVYLNTGACIHKYIDTRMYTFDAKNTSKLNEETAPQKKKTKLSWTYIKKKVRSSWAFWYCKSKYRHGKHLSQTVAKIVKQLLHVISEEIDLAWAAIMLGEIQPVRADDNSSIWCGLGGKMSVFIRWSASFKYRG